MQRYLLLYLYLARLHNPELSNRDMTKDTYSEAVAPLLAKEYKHSYKPKDWPDYVAEFGLTGADVPELCRMAIDTSFDDLDQDYLAVWAPLHALRALGQLRDPAAIAPLISLFSRDLDDFMSEILPVVFGMIGGEAIAPLETSLQDKSTDVWSRSRMISSLEEIAKEYPGDRPACIAVMTQELEKYATNDDIINSTLVDSLVELQVTDAAPLIETVFSEAEIDEMLTGSWPMVQVRLGIKQESDFSSEDLKPKIPESLKELSKSIERFVQKATKPKGFSTAPSTPPKKKKSKKSKKKKKR